MKIVGNYATDGYALIEGLVPEIAAALLERVSIEMGNRPIDLRGVTEYPTLLDRPALDVSGHVYYPMNFFLWGLTPVISQVVGKDLLPTYDFLRVYRQGDRCNVHSDRYSCEHSLSLTLGYSDGETWDLQVERERTDPSPDIGKDFKGAFSSIAMKPGDAVLYQGVHHRHGRTEPNPNRWSAHIFLHWVDRTDHTANMPSKDLCLRAWTSNSFNRRWDTQRHLSHKPPLH